MRLGDQRLALVGREIPGDLEAAVESGNTRRQIMRFLMMDFDFHGLKAIQPPELSSGDAHTEHETA